MKGGRDSSRHTSLREAIVIWRFTGSRILSDGSGQTVQRLVAGSFLLLVPFSLYEAIRRLVVGGHPGSNALGIALTASAVVLMPGLGVIVRRSDESACHVFGSGGTSV